MSTCAYPLLDHDTEQIMHDALHYMTVAELRQVCSQCALPEMGKKAELIARIMVFIQTGIVIKSPEIPAVSRAAQKKYSQVLDKDMLMLSGTYKNDAKTRLFFKRLIGPHFHFTAFGIDWLNERWLMGKPPTYQEFAEYWCAEYEHRKQVKIVPKKEWAYLTFLQNSAHLDPTNSSLELRKSWKKIREEKAAYAQEIIKSLILLK